MAKSTTHRRRPVVDRPHGLDALANTDTIVVPGWSDPHVEPSDAGLLDGRRATTHWMYADRLRAKYPKIRLKPDVLYIVDGKVMTSAGAAATAVGMPPGRWLQRERLRFAQRLLESSDKPVALVARRAGYDSNATMRAHFATRLKTSPCACRRTFRATETQSRKSSDGSIATLR